MNIKAYDFDALYEHDQIPYEQIMEMKAWKKAGNCCVLVSWRDGVALKQMAHHHGIDADYYISDAGACVWDAQGNVVAEGLLPKITLHTVIQAIAGNPFLLHAIATSIHLDAANQLVRYERFELRQNADINALLTHPINKLVLHFSDATMCSLFRDQIAKTLPDVALHQHHATLYLSAQVENQDLGNAQCQALYHAYRMSANAPFVYEQ